MICWYYVKQIVIILTVTLSDEVLKLLLSLRDAILCVYINTEPGAKRTLPEARHCGREVYTLAAVTKFWKE